MDDKRATKDGYVGGEERDEGEEKGEEVKGITWGMAEDAVGDCLRKRYLIAPRSPPGRGHERSGCWDCLSCSASPRAL